jgi:hypothetical protein
VLARLVGSSTPAMLISEVIDKFHHRMVNERVLKQVKDDPLLLWKVSGVASERDKIGEDRRAVDLDEVGILALWLDVIEDGEHGLEG